MRVLCLLARHGTDKYPEAITELRAFYASRLPEARLDLLVIDNAIPATHDEAIEGGRLVGGDNSAWEFSAWDSGLARAGNVSSYDFVHLVTSAFRTLHTRYIDRFEGRMLELVRGRAAAVGHIDYYTEPVQLLGVPAQGWLRSSFVFLPPAEVRMLGSLVGIRDGRTLFSGDASSPFREDAPLCSQYRRYVLDWLTGEGTGQGVRWHSQFDLGDRTLAFFEAKVLAMINEQLLSIRLRRQGCHLVDATWLATVAGRGVRGLGAIQPWRAQLRSRDTDARLVPVRSR